MLLRSGRIYSPPVKENKKIIKGACSICFSNYVPGDYICSCSKKKIKKHSFHISCFNEFLKYSLPFRVKCPYCLQQLSKPLYTIKV